jgi:hypothetical protein
VFLSDTEKDSNSGSASGHIESADTHEVLEIMAFDRCRREELSLNSLRAR